LPCAQQKHDDEAMGMIKRSSLSMDVDLGRNGLRRRTETHPPRSSFRQHSGGRPRHRQNSRPRTSQASARGLL